MKLKSLLLYALIFTNYPLYAQNKERLPCNCDALLEPQKRYFENEAQADSLMRAYVKQLWAFSRIKKIDDPFIIREAFCESPLSEICPDVLPDGSKRSIRLILYNDRFLKGLNTKKQGVTLVDKHVLLHEIGHHVLGHHKNARSIEALQIPYRRAKPDPKLWRKYGVNNPMAQEFEADIYAVWALSKLEPSFRLDDFIAQLNKAMINNLDAFAKHSDHPLFKDRIETMRKYQAQLAGSAGKKVPQRYFADIASTAYLALWPESYIYDLSLNAGVSLAGKTSFSTGGEEVEGFLYPVSEFKNYHIGFSIDRFRWDKPLQTGLDVQWSSHQYGTKAATADGFRLVEQLRVNYITFCPKITWNSIGGSKQQSLHSLRVGFLAGVGLNARIPLGDVRYVNHISGVATPKLLFSAGPKVTVGAAVTRKSFVGRGVKILFSYDPQWIRLQTDSDIRAFSHNLECTLQYTLKRW
ncbi:hypothetical protein SAMN05216327_10240 [Dyadobacter sp. SG02]|uniref:hypothetical protein n=1 Tax=Dyadobacter sp. SG02 TaxID=1855291 RepID=UPI0008D083F9|nr:hypothetical protein [Dyadobacter sp. SG02]SEI49762.1 hypothetical protein SAMN05216327_10240 [Dyadobacter sp. SG02]